MVISRTPYRISFFGAGSDYPQCFKKNGGFMLLFVPPDRRRQLQAALGDLLHVPFRFESSGSQIIFYERETPSDGS